jgi:formylglycine-generating enzyme
VTTAVVRRCVARISPWALLLAVSCDSVLGLEKATPRSECTDAGCAGLGATGNGGASGTAGTGKGAAGVGGTEAGEGGEMNGSGGRGGSGNAGSAGTRNSGGNGGEGGRHDPETGGVGGTAGAGMGGSDDAGAGGADDPECVSNTLRCDAYQPQRCDDGEWTDFGDECSGYCQDGACKAAPSCGPAAAPRTCGSGASCCDTIWIPGGTYQMGIGDLEDPDLSYSRRVEGFYLDRFEVTVGRFQEFVVRYKLPDEGMGAHPRISASGWQTAWESAPDYDHEPETAVPPTSADLLAQVSDVDHCPESSTYRESDPNLPINCVNWYVAFAFCVFDGGRLPTEAEWNHAAAYGSSHRPFPWSQSVSDTTVDTSRAAYHDPSEPIPLLPSAVGTHAAGQGGFFRNSGQGHEDLGGNVFEWVADQWTDAPEPTCESDCMAPWSETDDQRGVRGGSFQLDSSFLRSGSRNSSPAYYVHPFVGLRCARDATTEQ